MFQQLLNDLAPMIDVGRVSEPMARYALDLALAYPAATAPAIADKLLTVWPGTARALRTSVALAAMERARVAPLAA